jgi:replication factor C large subunit
MLSEKYFPKTIEDFVGNQKVASDLRNYNWEKPAILYGSIGVGKSKLAEIIANELGLEVIRITDENILQGRNIAQSSSLFGNKKLVVFDDVDSIKNIKEVPEILEVARNPVLLITSDFESKRLATIKKHAEKFMMRKPMTVSVAKLLEKISVSECIEVDKAVLTEIAEKSGGDIRSAVSDLEAAAGGKKKILKSDLEVLGSRDVSTDIYKALAAILMKKDIKESLQSIYDVDEQPQNVLLWIDENLPTVYKGSAEIEKAYHYLSRADIFMGRIQSKQYWGFLRYSNPLMTSGITASRPEKINFTRLQFPFYLIRMSQSKKERAFKKSIGQKMASQFHCSWKEAANSYVPLYKNMLKHGKIDAASLTENFKLVDEEIEYLEAKT